MAFRWIFALVLGIHLVSASPAILSPVCDNNPSYPILLGPLLKDIAQEFCSYYLRYPKTTTTVTVEATSTATETNTIAGGTETAKATVEQTLSVFATSTSIVPGPTFTSIVIETVTANAKEKREANPASWAPPEGSGDDYRPAPLAIFAPSQVSWACSCLVTPTTETLTATLTATVTTTQTTSQSPSATLTEIITNVQTVTSTITEIITNEVTTIITTTATAGPTSTAVSCPGPPKVLARAGSLDINDPETMAGLLVTLFSGFETSAECSTACFEYRDPNTGERALSYAFSVEPDQNFCRCFRVQSCSYFTEDLDGFSQAADYDLE